jgi:hypothetical protein
MIKTHDAHRQWNANYNDKHYGDTMHNAIPIRNDR